MRLPIHPLDVAYTAKAVEEEMVLNIVD